MLAKTPYTLTKTVIFFRLRKYLLEVASLTPFASLQARWIFPSSIRAADSLIVCPVVVRSLADTVRIADGLRLTTSRVACRFVIAPELYNSMLTLPDPDK